MTNRSVLIVTTAHWEGDPRLNRHLEYLGGAGHEAALVTFADRDRWAGLWSALMTILRADFDVVVLPDPELFGLGGIVARLRRKIPVIDIHEDYAKAAMARAWVPPPLRPVVSVFARFAVWLGRVAAAKVMVAAPDLRSGGDILVLNIPDPDSLRPSPFEGSQTLVYVGDVTPERGVTMMLESIAALDETFRLVIIGRVSDDAEVMIRDLTERLGLTDRVEVTGRLAHHDAWNAAAGSLAGLSLLTDTPAYRQAVATKLWEYLAIGLPPIVTDLPGQRTLVTRVDASLVCSTPREVAAAAVALAADPGHRRRVGETSRRILEEQWAANRPDLAVQSLVEP